MEQTGIILPAIRLRRIRFLSASAVLAVVSLCSMAFALCMGAYEIPLESVLQIVLGDAVGVPDSWRVVVLDIRLSRIALSWAVGCGLAVSGVVFQGILRNPLADPFTLGVSSGGAFGAALAITSGLTVLGSSLVALPLFALVGALGALCAVLVLGRIGGELRRETLVLAGIVVATFLSACISLFKALNEESVAAIVFWIMGSFQGRGWEHVLLYAPFAAIGTILILLQSRELDMLSLGESQASQLGVPCGRSRTLLLVGASCITAAAVSVCGVVGFIGLVVPHLVRLVQGGEHRPLLFNSALLGGLLLLWADVLARSILSSGAELPVGVVTALLGGPFFCYLLRTRYRSMM